MQYIKLKSCLMHQAMQFECYCQQKTSQDSFQCVICGKMHHNKCYHINFMERMPTNMKCIICRLSQYEPYYQIKENLCSRAFYLLLPGEVYNKKELHFDLKHRWNEFKGGQNQDVALVCTPVKPQLKKAADPNEINNHPKKNRVPPQYEWPSPNMFIEWNHTHIKYLLHSYAIIPRENVRQHNVLHFTVSDISNYNAIKNKESPSFFTAFIVERKKPQDLIHRMYQRMDCSENFLPELKQFYHNAIHKMMPDEQVMLQSPYLSVSLVDPITYNQIVIPARGKLCQHADSFDLMTFLETNLNPKENRWKCPRCLQYVDADTMLVDLIQFQVIEIKLSKILRNLHNTNPKADAITKINILDVDLNYQAEEKVAIEQTFQIKLSDIKLMVIKLFQFLKVPSLREFVETLFDPSLEVAELQREEITDWIDSLRETTDLFTLLTHEEVVMHLLQIMFNSHNYFTQEGITTPQSSSLELIGRQLYRNSFAGVAAEFASASSTQVRDISSILFAMCHGVKQKFCKYLELVMATSYNVLLQTTIREKFQKYLNKSFGYVVGYLMHVYFEKTNQSDEQKIPLLKYLQYLLPQLLYPKSQELLYSTAEFLIVFFQYFFIHHHRIRRKEQIKECITKAYGTELKDIDRINIVIIVYHVLVNLKRERPKPDSCYILPPQGFIQLENNFNEIIDQCDLKAFLRRNQLHISDLKGAFTLLDYDFSSTQREQVTI